MKKLFAAAVLVVVFAGTVAANAITDPSGPVHACYRNVGGQLRVAEACKKTETGITLNQSLPGYEVVTTTDDPVPANVDYGSGQVVRCPEGKKVVSGGAYPALANGGGEIFSGAFKIFESFPLDDGTGWIVSIGGSFPESWIPVAKAICVSG